ncbi:unnamed protein product [Xylocopa violacea]|uniref:Uncharacterized protein n=1 Tax=Xylocopa violacea TaxID=135666 RepID=A0ABP1N6F6_XYLVO
MFLQRQSYFSRLARSYPILKLVDIYDRQSFIRAYVLDNVYVCILMHVLFYAALWYATTVVKKMEKSNKEMQKIVEENKTRLEEVMALKDKKTEYDEVVVKAKEAQKLTSEELDDEMRRLSAELITAADKLTELERLVEKLIFSTNPAGNRARALGATSQNERVSAGCKALARDRRARSRISRYLNRPFRRLCRRNLRPGSTESLSLDLLANVVHLPQLQLRYQKSDSKASKFVWSGGDRRRDDRRRKRGRFFENVVSPRYNVRKVHGECLRNVTPFTRSLLGLVTIFANEKC